MRGCRQGTEGLRRWGDSGNGGTQAMGGLRRWLGKELVLPLTLGLNLILGLTLTLILILTLIGYSRTWQPLLLLVTLAEPNWNTAAWHRDELIG